jgi:4-aminobutyrate aminotransferase-like enzyme/Ser/Thr protein kinase RdoA (MazF antagonist)
MTDVAHPPRFFLDLAEALAEGLFGFTAKAATLPSERDQNFLLTDAAGRRFVLKVANPEEELGILEMQNEAMRRLAETSPGLCPVVVPNREGEAISVVEESGTRYFVRLVTYAEGTPLALVRPHSAELLRDLGRAVGRLSRGLDGFDHPAAHREFAWDLQAGTEVVRRHLDLIVDPVRRDWVRKLADGFDSDAVPGLSGLKRRVVHNDANDYNVIVGPAAADAGHFGRRSIAAIVDFGDMIHSYALSEPAAACAYAMLDKADPLAAAGEVIAGYQAEWPLDEQEADRLYPLIVLRLLLSVSLCAHQARLRPGDPYLEISKAPVWALLEQLVSIPPALARAHLRRACGFAPCADEDRAVAWLKAQACSCAPILGEPFADIPRVVFDLSIGSPLIAQPGQAIDPAVLAAILSREMKRSGARIGLGRYDEARIIYAVPTFKPEGQPLAEGRTVHLGIDVFAGAGTPVFTPIDGIVHGVRDNAHPFDYGPTVILEHRVEGGRLIFYTLYGHLRRASVEGLKKGTAIPRGGKVAEIGPFPENGGWPPHLHFQIILDMLGMEGDYPGVCRAGERDIWKSLCPDPNLLLGLPAQELAEPGLSPEAILETRRSHFGKSLSVSYKKPLKIVRGFMKYLYDDTGRAFLDAVNNVPHVGHSHPRVVEAVQRQMAVLNTNTRYLHDNLARYVERLAAKCPSPLRVCFIVNSGSEANDLALRMARQYTGQNDLIVIDGAYHGHLSSLIEISPYKFGGRGGAGRPTRTQVVRMPDLYQGAYRYADAGAGVRYAEDADAAIAAIRSEGRSPAGFIAESLLSCGGQIVLPDGYLAEVYKRVRAAGGVCIADEVQVGFGRVGTHFWGFETQGVVPDIVTMGKPIGNGFPLAAVVTTPQIADAFANGMEYFNTYGGNPVACAAGSAVLDVIEQEGLQENALATGRYLQAGLERLKDQHEIIGDVRGRGLFLGFELVTDRATRARAPLQAAYIAERMREEGILVSTDGPYHNVIKIKPPICFGKPEAELFLETLEKILGEDPLVL